MAGGHVTRHAICQSRSCIWGGITVERENRHGRSSQTAMLEELSSMDRITQLQDEIQNASFPLSALIIVFHLQISVCRQLLTIMSRSIAYLTTRVNFVQVSDEIPVTKQRNPEKVDPPDVFEGSAYSPTKRIPFLSHSTRTEQQTRRSSWTTSW